MPGAWNPTLNPALLRFARLAAHTELSTATIGDAKSSSSLMKAVRPAIDAKQHGYEDLLSSLVVKASLEIMPKNPSNFNVDSVRVVKILGGSVEDTAVVRGMVFGREPESTLQKAQKAKIAVFTCPLDVQMTETKGTVLIKNATEMLSFSKGEEAQMEQQFREIAESGAKVLVTGSSIGDLALHFINRMDMMVVKVLSKFDLRRLCKVVGATALTRVGKPLPEELGYCDIVETVEIGSDRCTVFRQGGSRCEALSVGCFANHVFLIRPNLPAPNDFLKFVPQRWPHFPSHRFTAHLIYLVSLGLPQIALASLTSLGSFGWTRAEDESTRTATIVVRGATQNLLDDIERAIDDGVNVVKSVCKDPRIVPGAGAVEIEIARRLAQFGDKTTGLNQYSIKKFAESLEVVPRTLAENAGLDSTEVISSLYAAHQKEGGAGVGINIEPETDGYTLDAVERSIWDSTAVKKQAIKLATHAAVTVLSVDQIVGSEWRA